MYSICVLGFLSHVCYFLHGEHHLLAFVYFQLLTFALVMTVLGVYIVNLFFEISLATRLLKAEAVFLFSLLGSILVYRASPFHRLWSFPGPFIWRLTKLTEVWRNRNLRGFEVLDQLHRKHGDIIRTGKESPFIVNVLCNVSNATNRTFRTISTRSRSRQCDTGESFEMYALALERHESSRAIRL